MARWTWPLDHEASVFCVASAGTYELAPAPGSASHALSRAASVSAIAARSTPVAVLTTPSHVAALSSTPTAVAWNGT